jgi:hypothetical protein
LIRFISIFTLLLAIQFGELLAQKVVQPFQTHNQSPVVHFFGLPANQGGVLQEEGKFSLSNFFYISNNATSKRIGEEAIYLDGEMYRNELYLKYGLSDKFEIALHIPIVKHSSGVMDPFISGWHDAFNMPEKARATMVKSALTYAYTQGEAPVFNVGDGSLELGDISLSLAMQLFKGEKDRFAIQASYKRSVGSKRKLIGSGTNDFSIQFSGSRNAQAKAKQLATFYSLGYLRVGNGALLEDLSSKDIVFGSIGLGYCLSKSFVPKMQIDAHTGFYRKSALKQLGNDSMQLSIGFDYLISDKFTTSFAFIEDLIVNTAPDFVLQFGVSYKF